MSQIGEGKATIEGLGRPLGASDGKAGRLAAAGGSAREEFARLMASAQGRFKTGGDGEGPRAENASPANLPAGGKAGGDGEGLQRALAEFADRLTTLRKMLDDGGGGKGGPGASALSKAEESLQSALKDLVAALEGRGGDRVEGVSGGDAGGESDLEHLFGEGGSRESSLEQSLKELDPDLVAQAGWRDAGSSRAKETGEGPVDDLSSTMKELGEQIEALADALAQWRDAMDAKRQPDAALEEVVDRLAALREGLGEGRSDAEALGEGMNGGLVGQLQALEQALRRAETAAGGEVRVARGMAPARGEGGPDWEAGWRFAEIGRRQSAAGDGARLGGGGETNRDVDWSGGPVSAALGLTGREAGAVERAPLTRWSALSGLEGRHAASGEGDSALGGNAGTPATATGFGGNPASLSAGGGSASGVFTGQSATGAPNPQMPTQLGQQIQWMVGKGVSKASIELRPADLGPLKIAIETQGDETRIALTATNPTAQGLLEQQLPRLKEWLQESGLANSEVEVGLGQEGDFGEQLADADDGGQADAGGLGGEAADESASGQAGMDAVGEDDAPGEWAEGRLVLDLFA